MVLVACTGFGQRSHSSGPSGSKEQGHNKDQGSQAWTYTGRHHQQADCLLIGSGLLCCLFTRWAFTVFRALPDRYLKVQRIGLGMKWLCVVHPNPACSLKQDILSHLLHPRTGMWMVVPLAETSFIIDFRRYTYYLHLFTMYLPTDYYELCKNVKLFGLNIMFSVWGIHCSVGGTAHYTEIMCIAGPQCSREGLFDWSSTVPRNQIWWQAVQHEGTGP